MIVKAEKYVVISHNSNDPFKSYWGKGPYPDWTFMLTFGHFTDQPTGYGVEPHYHDCDEFWLFAKGHGEAWLDGQSHRLTANTAVYTPMGTVHRFQMFAPFETVAVVSPLEREKRRKHILVEEEGPPVPTVPGFVAPGADNNGPFPDRGSRCPLSELRVVALPAGAAIDDELLEVNEYWMAMSGSTVLEIDGREFELSSGDVAMLRSGATRRLRAVDSVRLALARE